MSTSITTDEDLELWSLFRQVNHAILRARNKELRPLGISSMQSAVLRRMVIKKAPMTITEISESLLREPHSVSYLLNRMERKGLVEIIRDPQGKKQITAAITEKGEKAYQDGNKLYVVGSTFSSLSPKERGNLKSYLKKLRQRLFHDITKRAL